MSPFKLQRQIEAAQRAQQAIVRPEVSAKWRLAET
jgi:hypothetical protein